MSVQFELIPTTGNVLLKDGANILNVMPPTAYVSKEGSNPDKLVINSEPTTAQESRRVEVLASNVTFPAHSGVDDLIRKLSESFFKGPPPKSFEGSVGNTDLNALGIGATFTGVIESSLFSDVMVHVETDQDGTLFFDFTQDGVNFDTFPFAGFAHTAGIPSFHIAVKGGQQFRVRFVNTSGIVQTYFRLYTYYGSFRKPNAPVGTIITDDTDATTVKAVLAGKTDGGDYVNVNATPSGNMKATLFDSQTNSRQIVDLNGAAKTGQATILVGDAFGGQVPNALQWITEFVGSGASLSLPGTQRIEAGVTANSEARFQSVQAARFMISQFNIYHGGIRLDNISDPDTVRTWGIYDPIAASPNGLFWRVDGGNWFVGSVKDGVETTYPLAGWNGSSKDQFNETPDLSVYEIQYNAGTAFFFQGPNYIHRITGLTSPYAGAYNFKVGLEVINRNGNITNNGIDFRAAGVYRLGVERGGTISRAFVANTLVKNGAGFVASVALSRAGSGGGAGILSVYDGIDATGILMARIDIGANDFKPHDTLSTFTEGLFIAISGTGINTATIVYE